MYSNTARGSEKEGGGEKRKKERKRNISDERREVQS